MRHGLRATRPLLVLVALLPALAAACGNEDDPAPGPVTPGLGVGVGGSPENAFPCAEAEPLMSDDTGYLRCESGLVVRSARRDCPSLLPREEDVADYQFGIDECQNDAGCTRFANGFCQRAAPGEKATCGYGCVTDDDCQGTMICACGEPVGLCVEATCRSDDDCVDGFHCAASDACAGSFHCQHEDDSCATDDDCDEGICVVYDQRRSCTTDTACVL